MPCSSLHPGTSDFPDFITNLEQAPTDGPVACYLSRGQVLVSFYHAQESLQMAEHAHGRQWGVVLTGTVSFTIAGVRTTYGPGDAYYIDAGLQHIAELEPGTSGIDVFADPDRY